MLNKILFYLFGLICGVAILRGLNFGQSALVWTVDATDSAYPLAPFLRDYVWHIEGAMTFLVFMWAFKVRFVGLFIAWLGASMILWLACVTFSLLEISVRDVPVQVNGIPVHAGP